MGSGLRRRSREAALQLLYQMEITSDSSPEAFELFWLGHPKAAGEENLREFSESLVTMVLNERERLDALIDNAASNWEVGRLSCVDLSLLRMATAELLFCPGVPGEVVVDEAVAIARRFSDVKSASFINGVLDNLAHEQGRIRTTDSK